MGIIQDLIAKYLPQLLSLVEQQAVKEVQTPVQPVQLAITQNASEPTQIALDWSNPKSHINARFTVHEATWLPSWSVYHQPTDEQKQAIIEIASGVDKAISLLEKQLGKHLPCNVHAWMRPDKAICPGSKWDGQDYNRYIYETQVWVSLTSAQKAEKHVPLSPHRTGHAVDFHLTGFEDNSGCDKIREMLKNQLEGLSLRMEDISAMTSRGWVHLDNLPVIHQRFFKP